MRAALAKEAPESRVSPVSVAQDVEGEQGEDEDDEEAEDKTEVSDLMIWKRKAQATRDVFPPPLQNRGRGRHALGPRARGFDSQGAAKSGICSFSGVPAYQAFDKMPQQKTWASLLYKANPKGEIVGMHKIHPCLPSFKAESTSSVTLTRIRDIAHRGDILHNLKSQMTYLGLTPKKTATSVPDKQGKQPSAIHNGASDEAKRLSVAALSAIKDVAAVLAAATCAFHVPFSKQGES
ncbi:phosphoglucan, water dikinase [Sarracenia purpurea var. burkii]